MKTRRAPDVCCSTVLAAGILLAVLSGCATPGGRTQPFIRHEAFGEVRGTAVGLWTLGNGHGMSVQITNYGGIVVSIRTPDRDGVARDVVLGYRRLDEYVQRNPFFGCLVGRYANRIADGRFVLDGREYDLERNAGPNHIHGGRQGFDKVVWDAEAFSDGRQPGLRLTHTSPAGHAGFPGTVQVTVTYLLRRDNTLQIDYEATTDEPTHLNLTNHSYFNLNGEDTGDVLGHELQVNADAFTPVVRGLIPTGEIAPVDGTPFDLRRPRPIGEAIAETHEQLELGRGFDHNWVVRGGGQAALVQAATLYAPESGIELRVWTTEPGLQVYTGNYLNGAINGKTRPYGRHAGICLETQHFPNSPNRAAFPSTVLRPGDTYRSATEFRFGIRR